MIQTEAQRQFYLGAAGIRLWYAREPLPGAAPSPEFVFPEPEEPRHPPVPGDVPSPAASSSAGSVPSPMTDQQGSQRIANLQALMADKSAPETSETQAELRSTQPPRPKAVEPDADVAAALPSRGETAPLVSLSMGVFSDDRYILVAQVSREASMRLQETLARNILKSLGVGSVGNPEWVHWPVFNNRLVPGNTLHDLKSVMAQVMGDCNEKKVVALGSLEVGKGNNWLADVLQRAVDVECEHTLAELAGDPGLKRVLWQQLKSLAAS